MKLYRSFLKTHLKAQLQDRASFVLVLLGNALITLTGFVLVFVVMRQDIKVLGFSRDEVLLCGSITTLSFALAEMLARGFDNFPLLLANGQFDRIALRPQNEVFQILTATIDFTRLGRAGVAFLILIFACLRLPLYHPWILVLMILGGFILYVCLFIIYGSLSFFTTESLEFMNILTDGSRELGKFPVGIFGERLLKILTFVFPFALFQYYPFLLLIGRDVPLYYAFLPLVLWFMILPTRLLWRYGRSHYRSTGS